MQIKKLLRATISLLYLLMCAYSQNSYSSELLCQNQDIQEIEKYISSLDKVAIDFVQTGREGEQEQYGLLIIEKPYKFRVNYDQPYPMIITGGKNFVSVYDYELDELSRIDAKDNIFKFLLDYNARLDSTVHVNKCNISLDKYKISLSHIDTGQDATIIFSKKPMKIVEMQIEGEESRIIFGELHYFTSAPQELFILRDTKLYGTPRRYSNNNILEILNINK